MNTLNAHTMDAAGVLIRVGFVADESTLLDYIDVLDAAAKGIALVTMSSALEFYRYMFMHDLDVVILGSELPDDSHLTLLRHLRAHSKLALIFVESTQLKPDQRNELNAVVDLFLPAKFTTADLASTVDTVGRSLRISRNLITTHVEEPAPRWWSLDAQGWCLVAPSETRIRLSRMEIKALSVLLSASGRIVTRENLIDAIAGGDPLFEPRRLEMIIYRLRRKVLERSHIPLPLITVRGLGYVFALNRQPT